VTLLQARWTDKEENTMRGIGRLIDGLQKGDLTAIAVLIFAVVGTAIIFIITQIIQKKRQKNMDRGAMQKKK
jgi:hypothetical protein